MSRSGMSGAMPCTTYRFKPTGGVIKPISMFRVITTPNHIGSNPSSVMIGNRTGMVTRIIATGGMKHPRKRNSRFMITNTTHLFTWRSATSCASSWGTLRKLKIWPSTAEKATIMRIIVLVRVVSRAMSVHEVSQVHRAIQEGDQDQRQESAHARSLARGGNAQVQDPQDAGYQHGERDHLRQHAKAVLPGVALLSADDLRGSATLSCAAGLLLDTRAPPAREHHYQNPQTEQQRDHDARHDAAQKQAADRRLCGYTIQDQGDARRDQYAQRTPCDYRPRRQPVRVASLGHLGNGYPPDRSGGRGARTGQGSEHRARHHGAHGQAAREPAHPYVRGLEQILARFGVSEDRAHQDEERDGQQPEVI